MKNPTVMGQLILIILCLTCYGFITVFIPDHAIETRIFYNKAEAEVFFHSLSLGQIENYKISLLIDIFFITFYTTFLAILGWRAGISRAISFWPGSFDLIETVGIFGYLAEAISLEVVSYLGPITFLKWLGAFYFAVIYFYKKLHRPASNSSN